MRYRSVAGTRRSARRGSSVWCLIATWRPGVKIRFLRFCGDGHFGSRRGWRPVRPPRRPPRCSARRSSRWTRAPPRRFAWARAGHSRSTYPWRRKTAWLPSSARRIRAWELCSNRSLTRARRPRRRAPVRRRRSRTTAIARRSIWCSRLCSWLSNPTLKPRRRGPGRWRPRRCGCGRRRWRTLCSRRTRGTCSRRSRRCPRAFLRCTSSRCPR